MSCGFCTFTTRICFWHVRPIQPWHRPMLFAGAMIFVLGIPLALACGVAGPSPTGVFGDIVRYLLILALRGLGVFCLLVALRGCDGCVERMIGDG